MGPSRWGGPICLGSPVSTIGLTGGIGSGKSAVAALLRAHGATVIDADQIAREIVEPGMPALAEIVAEFGRDVLQSDGTLDRARLAAIVFGDAERLAVLNRITHPRIDERRAQITAEAAPEDLVVYDMPLLVESGRADGWDAVVVVDAPDELRLQRLIQQRGMDPADVARRMSAQASRAERLAAADFVIDNSGSPEDLVTQVDVLLDWLRHRIGSAG